MKRCKLLVTALFFSVSFLSAQAFIHPGILHSKEDLERMKNAVISKEEPVYSGFAEFIKNPASQHAYKMKGPMEMVGRNPTVGQATYDEDANAAHQNAIMWAITGDKQYAGKSIEIINAWSATLKSITGRDAVLMAGLGPFKMVNAAEIIRYTHAGWSEQDIKQTEKHFKEIIYPVLKNFAPFANGNWDAAAIKTVMAIGVFCNDPFIFESGLQYYVNGSGNGRLTNYVINETGQIQESGRDQAHTQLGIGLLAECCEIAWHQGLDLYGYADNRLLKGFEYVAKFNLGNDVPFSETLDRTGKYHQTTIAQQERGKLRAVYEQVYNHYTNLCGLSAPFTRQAAEKLRPEGPGRPGADHPGYGTLFFSRSPGSMPDFTESVPSAPGGIVATPVAGDGIDLTWINSNGASVYSVKRSTTRNGVYLVIATNIKDNKYIDKKIKKGSVYYYSVSASNKAGESNNAYPVGISAGLPENWRQASIGVGTNGYTLFNGEEFIVTAAGMGIDSVDDSFQFTYLPVKTGGEMVARFAPQPSSQSSKMGLTLRNGTDGNGKHVSLMIYPGKTNSAEAPQWHIRMLSRDSIGKVSLVKDLSPGLTDPAVTYGRLTGYCWLRLQYRNGTVSGFYSYDGKKWKEVSTVDFKKQRNSLIGMVVCSGMENPTAIRVDNMIHRQDDNDHHPAL